MYEMERDGRLRATSLARMRSPLLEQFPRLSVGCAPVAECGSLPAMSTSTARLPSVSIHSLAVGRIRHA